MHKHFDKRVKLVLFCICFWLKRAEHFPINAFYSASAL